MNYKNLIIETKNKILIVKLNRADKLNILSEELLLELHELLLTLKDATKNIRGLIITGAENKMFSAGGDIKFMKQLGEKGGENLSELAQRVTVQIEKLPVPAIACVDGFALGGGCELAMSCDFIYATKASIFAQPETKIGLIPGFGGNIRLVRLVGPAKAKELIYTGRQILAEEAQRIGLVNQVFDTRIELFEAAMLTMSEMANNSSFSVAKAKSTLNLIIGQPTEVALSIERKSYGSLFEHPEKVEGINAFLEKRKAKFQ